MQKILRYACSIVLFEAVNLEQTLTVQCKGPYADHILISWGLTRSSTIFDIKWKLIFF